MKSKNSFFYLFFQVLLASSMLSSCAPKVEEIRFGSDQCHYCKMIISDPKFGAELVTDKGKVFKFDAAECMLNHLKEIEDEGQEFSFMMAISYDTPKQLHDVHALHFLVSENMPSPMGGNLNAFSNKTLADEMKREKSGELFSWASLASNYGLD